MPRYEYRSVEVSTPYQIDSVANTYGETGWEAYHIHRPSMPTGNPSIIIYFKRALPAKKSVIRS